MEDKDNEKFVFISESCIPLKSFDNFYNKMMMDDIRTSYVKFMNISGYDMAERIKTQPGYEKQGKFVKHYARMCLSRYHAEKLLKKDFKFFNEMHVGDEFFLTMIHPTPGKDFMKDFEITYDNWEDVRAKTSVLSKEMKDLCEKYNIEKDCYKHVVQMNQENQNTFRRKKALHNDIGRNPKTYTTITTHDIERAIKRESFFWRKFTNDPLPWTPELLNIISAEEPQSIKKTSPVNLKTRKQRNKQNRKTYKKADGISI
jgi:hypothetical protein